MRFGGGGGGMRAESFERFAKAWEGIEEDMPRTLGQGLPTARTQEQCGC